MDELFKYPDKILNKINEGIIYADPNGKPIYFNKAAQRILGLKLNDFTILRAQEEGYQIIDLDGKNIPIDQYPFNVVIKTKKPVQDVIVGIYQIKTRQTNWILMESEPAFLKDGVTLKGVLTTINNISSQIEIEQKLSFQTRLQILITKTAENFLGILGNDHQVAVQASLEEVGKFLESDRVFIFEYDFIKKVTNNTYEWFSQGSTPLIHELKNIPLGLIKDWVSQHKKKKVIHIPDISALELDNPLRVPLESQSIQSLITVPIFKGLNCIGFIAVVFVQKKHFFIPEEQNLLMIFAGLYANMKARVEYNKQLKESEERLQKIINSPTHYLFRTDLQGRYTYWNETFEEAFGWMYGEKGIANSDSLISTYNYHHKPTQEVINACIENPGSVHQIELDKPSKDGGVITTLWEFVCLTNASDKPSEIQCMGIDISAKKIAEEKVRKLSRAVEQIPLTVVITNLEGNIEYANPYTFQTTGYTQEELLGKNPKVLKSGETASEEYNHLWNNITHGKEWKGIFHNKKKDGSLYWEQATIGPILDDEGKITHYIAIKEDITERKKIQDELKDLNLHLEEKIKERTLDLENSNISLQQANSETQKANQAKIDFLSKMSHELRTPMNSILGFGQLLQMGELNPVQEKGVQHILDSGKHLLNLINEVLDISRIESGKISISVEPIEVCDVINEIIDGLMFSANQRGISINFQLKEETPVFVRADKQRLKQVLINLINNAIKFNYEGGEVNIVVNIKPTSEDGYTPIRISVIDTGWGIEAKDLERIFIPFERIGAEKTKVEGTGLGLTVVKQLIDLMGGKVGVKSKPGEGSTFWIELQQSEDHLNIIEKEEKLSHHPTEHNQVGVILYIEDNAPNIELVQEIIETKRKGINLIIHMRGSGAMEKILETTPTLILLDLNLPDRHGEDILKELKSNNATKHIPVIVISADAMPDQIIKLKTLGAKNYLTKPIEIKSFLEAIDEIIK